PFVYGLAMEHNLTGWVCNTSEDVKIEVEGRTEALEQFYLKLKSKAPPLARIEGTTISYHPPFGYENFEIRHSVAEEGKYQLISPDITTCQACLSELLNPNDRRFRYPFTNCTNCGPRFTIIEDMPYDRPKTTMRYFQMCPECQAEYDNPLDRRFHAQPNACPKCGPLVELVDNQGNLVIATFTQSSSLKGKGLGEGEMKPSLLDPIASASRLLKEGKIVAVKGLGGFLLACDALNKTAVKTLRERKKRPSKPFAIMVTDVEEAKRHCYVSLEEEKLLTSPQSPIVLLEWKQDSSIAREVTSNLRYLGVMLPYTPLHHVLLRDTELPLVMTSGNLSEEPIAKDNDEALRRLSGIADYLLVHNRDIYSRYDDSVALVEQDTNQLIRRARSYAPYPIHLTFNAKQVLGCGAEEKNTFCLTRDDYAFLSQHIGDMENVETLEHFDSTLSLYKRLFRIEPEIIAHDLHPDYLSTEYARELEGSGVKLVPVQHHHAHIASCMADNGVESQVIGVALDGTGLGTDERIWGSEFLVADYHGFTRAGHLEYLPLPGGDLAVKKPYRTTIGYILSLLGERTLGDIIDVAPLLRERELEIEIIKHQVEKNLNSPLTSSMGRLFDAISALTGIRGEIDYEGQAAIELEMAVHAPHYKKRSSSIIARSVSDGEIFKNTEIYPYHIAKDQGVRIIQLGELLLTIIGDLKQNVSRAKISLKFHNTVAQMVNEMCELIANETAIKQVALSGGVFQNRLLLRKTVNLLKTNGFQVLTHKQSPCNDGGISLGQAVIANFATAS
ncbi:MAG: carbamoyltransferase HypF, partial [Chloroflexota bacterium]|nr:carbamoyltransferase HypF [Chloroflexota bacterium]